MSRLGFAVFAGSFALLVCAAAPGLYLRDSGELTTAAWSLGIAHETGFPLYLLLGKAAALVPLGEVATRLAFLSAACGALTAWLVYRVVRALAPAPQPGAAPEAANDLRRVAEVAGVGAAALLLAGLTFFKSSTVAEVYAPTAAAIVLALYLFQRARAGERRAALCLAFVGGLSLGLHGQLRILLGPPVALWALFRLRKGERWPLLAPFSVALGAAVVVYLPLRAARTPVADWADPRTLSATLAHLSAARIRRAFADQIFPHDWHTALDHARGFGGLLEGQLGIPALLAAAGGLGWLVRTRRTRALGLLLTVLLAGDLVYSVLINPMGIEDLQCGVPTALGLAVALGAGIYALATRLGRAGPWAAGALSVLLCVPAALADADAKTGLSVEAGAWTDAALTPLPPRALLLTASDDLSAGVLYEQAVAGARPDVTALVRQQLWDGSLVAQRLAHAGHEVRALDGWLVRSQRERIANEDELLRTLVHDERKRREVAWEPATDAVPWPIDRLDPGVPLFRLAPLPDGPVTLPQARPLAARIEALSQPGRDPMVRQKAAGALSSLGRIYLARDDEARAGGLFETALALRPGDAVAATNLAVVRAKHGDFAGALQLVTSVLEREPERLVARVNAGRYRLKLDDLEGADRDFRLAHERAPRDPAPIIGLARVALRRNQPTDARRLAADARAVAPNDPELHALEEELRR